MPRLDEHVTRVRNRLALGRLLDALAWASVGLAAAIVLGMIAWILVGLRPPRVDWFIYAGIAAGVIGSIAWALLKRPSAHDAAVAIDRELGLKEKFSTALYARGNPDPFAQAAV